MPEKMTHRQRAITAITGGIPDFVPTFELVFHETERDFQGRTFFGTPFEPDSTGMSYTDIVKYNAQLYVDVARRFDHSIIFVNSTLRNHEPKAEEGMSHCTQGTLDTIKAIRDIDGGERLVMNHNDPTFMIPFGNAEEFCVNLFLEPDMMHETARASVENAIESCDTFQKAGSDGFIMCCDYCTNDGPFVSPPQFDEFIAPYLKQSIAEFKARGAYIIKHTDGNIMPILDALIDAAPHALHSIDPMAGVDIKVVKERCGDKVALCGNVHCAHLQSGTPQEIRESAEYCLTHAKPRGGYVFSTSNCVFRGMPLESYDLIHDIWMKNRDY